jgi:hypothetical protein
MIKKYFELDYETIDRIVSDELMDAYARNLIEDTDEGGFSIERDEKLLAALETCMEYFMIPSEYKKFMSKYNG